MKAFSLVATLLFITLQCRIAIAEVVDLTPESFAALASTGTWFVEHFAPWCGHCQRFAPVWTQLGDDYANLKESKNFHIAKIDCTVYGDLCNEHNVRGYPTVQLYVNGEFIEDYAGARDLDVVAAYIVKVADEHAPAVANLPRPKPIPVPANPDGKVIQLTPASYETKVVGSDKQWFIQMYTPWCRYCKDMSSAWTQLASSLKDKINVASINCEAGSDAKAFCMKHKITGYPTIQFVSGEQTSEYKGAREVDTMLQFTKKYNSELQEITGAQLTSIQQDDSVAFIHLYNEDSKASLELIAAVSKSFVQDVPFYITADPISIRHLGYEIGELPASIILKGKHKFVHASNNYANTLENRNAVQTWVQKEKFPIVNEIGLNNAEEILKSDHLVAFALFNGAKDLNSQKKEFKTMTEAWLDKGNKNSNIIFAWLDGVKWSDYVNKVFGIKKSDLPRIVIVDPKNARFYPKDVDGRMLTMNEPQNVLKSIVEAQNDVLEGVSTKPSAHLPIEQDRKSEYHSFVQSHQALSVLLFAIVLGIAYRVFISKRSASDLLPTSSTAKHHE
ncbi:thioredoxin-like protein [Umbelopsis sp. AD052]|nr:thioredoxin-like protein [Umbelopsis sp. AD052]